MSAGKGKLDVVEYLAGERGAAIEAKADDGHTALVGGCCECVLRKTF